MALQRPTGSATRSMRSWIWACPAMPLRRSFSCCAVRSLIGCALLPGLETSTGVRWLWAVSAAFPQFASDIARQLVPPGGPDRSQTAVLVGLWLHPISVELAMRHDAANPGRPIARRLPSGEAPAPSELLRTAHAHHRAEVARAAEGGSPHVAVLQRAGIAVAEAARAPLSDAEDPAWGGWALLAALQAIDEFEEVLRRPGRDRARALEHEPDARAADQAFVVGRDIMLTTALALLDSTRALGAD